MSADLLDLLKQMQAERLLEPTTINGRVLLVDATNSYIRCFAAVPTMNEDGVHVGGISGFLKSVGLAIRTFKPSRCVLVFDGTGGSQRRRKLYPEYKDNRRTRGRFNRTYNFKDVTEEEAAMKFQLMALAHMLKCLPVTVLAISNVEADDVIAYLAKTITEDRQGKAIIMSTDRDFFQIVNDDIQVFNPIKKKMYDPPTVVKEYGVHPHNFVLYRMMDGDSSDNISGIKGVGHKTIVKYFPQLQEPVKVSIDDVITFAEAQPKGAIYSKVKSSRTLLERNHELMRLDEAAMSGTTKLDILHRLDATPVALDRAKLQGLIREHRMVDAFGDIDRWILTTFHPLTRFPLEPNDQTTR